MLKSGILTQIHMDSQLIANCVLVARFYLFRSGVYLYVD